MSPTKQNRLNSRLCTLVHEEIAKDVEAVAEEDVLRFLVVVEHVDAELDEVDDGFGTG